MPIRILQVVSIMNRGGEETMIMNYYRRMDRDKIQFDFLVHQDAEGVYEDEIKKLGGRIYRAFPIRPWNYSKYRKWLDNFFKEHNEFSAVHAHILENCGFVLESAKNAGIKVRIAHSHLAQVPFDYKYPFRVYGKHVLKNCGVTKRLACGEEAGQYLFGKDDFEVMPNAVDMDSFGYNEEIRKSKRKELNLENKIIIGNVARFHVVKNQTYLVDIFASFLKREKDAVLLLVGMGEQMENVKQKVSSLGLEDKVFFLGVRTDVNELLQAMDVFVFPSKLEGLPLSLVEAQCAGLPCLLSDRVAKETAITDLVEFIPLEKSPDEWAQCVSEALKKERKNVNDQISAAHYDIAQNVSRLEKIYLGEA
ncbi:MAG: glycosyltransferase family 1 protein [Acutalibacteraceae bacterium]